MTPDSAQTAIGEDRERVLLLVSNQRDRSLIADMLDRQEVIVPESLADLPAFDICVVDTSTYPRAADSLRKRKTDADPVFVPVLLVLGPSDSEHDIPSEEMDFDDVVQVPTSKRVFESRVDALLRTRRQSERLALYQRAMDAAVTGITLARADGDQELVYVNEAFTEITGYERSAVLGRNCRFLQGPDTDDEAVREIRHAIEAREPITTELLNYRQDGTPFWNRVEIVPIQSRESVTHFVGFQQDVTERVERTRTLRRYEQIVRAAGDPIYTLDGDLRFTLLNEATTALSDEETAVGLGDHVGTVLGKSHASALAEAVVEMAETGITETTIETTTTDTSGRNRTFQTAVAMIPGTEFDGVVCVSRDVTSHRQREHRLSVLDRVLRHNLRNKLHVVLAQVEFVQAASDDEAVQTPAAAIERAAEELLDLGETARKFDDTLDPGSTYHVDPMDLVPHVKDLAEETRLGYEDVTVTTLLPDHAWARVHDSFEMGLSELLDNAAEYGGPGTTIEVSVRADGERVLVTVADDGPGMSAVEQDALTAGVESDLQHTNGLGLWFVRWMTVNSGGSLKVRDNDPEGTVVELSLPAADPQ